MRVRPGVRVMGVERWRVHRVVTDQHQDMKHDGSMLLLIVSVGDREDVGVHPEIVNVLAPVSSVAYSLHKWMCIEKENVCEVGRQAFRLYILAANTWMAADNRVHRHVRHQGQWPR